MRLVRFDGDVLQLGKRLERQPVAPRADGERVWLARLLHDHSGGCGVRGGVTVSVCLCVSLCVSLCVCSGKKEGPTFWVSHCRLWHGKG